MSLHRCKLHLLTVYLTFKVYNKCMTQQPQNDAPGTLPLSLDDLCRLSARPKRTVRYYIQLGLMDKPLGEKRGAYYEKTHLEQLLRIRELSEAGLSLERIRGVLRGAPSGVESYVRQAGHVLVRSHVYLAPGLELVISPDEARLSPEALLLQ